MLDLVPERKGVYLFILPNLKVGYVGSSNNLKRRYLQHIGVTKGGNKLIKDQVDRENKVEYMILEFCDGYSTKDLKLIESNWIKHFNSKGLNLINVSEPTTEPIYGESKAVVAYNAKTLEFVGEYSSILKAAKQHNISTGNIGNALKTNFQSTGKTKTLSIKNCFWFYKDSFNNELLIERKKEYEQALLHHKTQSSLNRLACRKKIIQYSKTGEFIKIWDSGGEAARSLNIHPPNISQCCRERLKSTGGFIWRYAESEETN